METPASSPPQRMVWWALWAAFQLGIVVIYFFIGGSRTTPETEVSNYWVLGLLPALISGALRWSVLPMFTDATKAFPILLVGLALAEVTAFLGMFLFPAQQALLFGASVVGILQFIPVYFNRYFEAADR